MNAVLSVISSHFDSGARVCASRGTEFGGSKVGGCGLLGSDLVQLFGRLPLIQGWSKSLCERIGAQQWLRYRDASGGQRSRAAQSSGG